MDDLTSSLHSMERSFAGSFYEIGSVASRVVSIASILTGQPLLHRQLVGHSSVSLRRYGGSSSAIDSNLLSLYSAPEKRAAVPFLDRYEATIFGAKKAWQRLRELCLLQDLFEIGTRFVIGCSLCGGCGTHTGRAQERPFCSRCDVDEERLGVESGEGGGLFSFPTSLEDVFLFAADTINVRVAVARIRERGYPIYPHYIVFKRMPRDLEEPLAMALPRLSLEEVGRGLYFCRRESVLYFVPGMVFGFRFESDFGF